MSFRIVIFITVVCGMALGMLAGVSWREIVTESNGTETWQRVHTHDFGRVCAGQKVIHQFVLTNPLGRPVRITRLQTSCGCTIAKLPSRTIEENSKIVLPIELQTAGKSGPVSEAVRVEIDGETWIALMIQGNVEASHVADIDFGTFKRGQVLLRQFEVKWPRGLEINITKLGFDEKYLEASIQVPDLVKRAHAVTVKLKPDLPYGQFNVPLQVYTNDEFAPVKRVTLRGFVLPPLISEPNRVMFEMLRYGQAQVATVRIYSPYMLPIEILDITIAEGEMVSWEVTRMSPSEIQLVLSADLSEDISRTVFKSVISVLARIESKEERLAIEAYGLVDLSSLSQTKAASQSVAR